MTSDASKTPEMDGLFSAITVWMEEVIQTDEFRAFKRDAIGYTLDHDDPYFRDDRPRCDFQFPDDIARQHDLVMKYFHLLSALHGLKQTEYYFRRYPFANLPVGRTDHIRNMCEMYFSYFYMIRERIKAVLSALNGFLAPERIDVGKLIKAFDKEFDRELRERHGVHHRESFDDVGIDKVHLTELIAMSPKRAAQGWRQEHLTAYRRTTREWSSRARRRAAATERFIEAIAGAILREARFLHREGAAT